MIYADHNATTPVDPEVRAAMAATLDVGFGNASSPHRVGQEARRLVERARAQVAGLIGAQPDEIIFTSGGTEADNLAVLGVVRVRAPERVGVIASSVEHQAVLAPCRQLQSEGHPVCFLPVDREGMVDIASLAAAVNAKVALCSVMWANNETGTLEPVAEIAKVAASCGAVVHTDAVQAAGKVAIDVKTLPVSLLSLSSHKIHGPKGAGALYLRRGVRLAPLIQGGRQERSLRPGTENVPAIVGFGKACELAAARLVADSRRVALLRDRFERQVFSRIGSARVNGGHLGGDTRLPNTSNLSFSGLDGEAITINLDMLEVAASNGAACSAVDHEPSHVLLAMGQSEAKARSAVRFSFGRDNTEEEIDRAVDLLAQVVARLRKVRP
jgi:cysteine desulfurase